MKFPIAEICYGYKLREYELDVEFIVQIIKQNREARSCEIDRLELSQAAHDVLVARSINVDKKYGIDCEARMERFYGIQVRRSDAANRDVGIVYLTERGRVTDFGR